MCSYHVHPTDSPALATVNLLGVKQICIGVNKMDSDTAAYQPSATHQPHLLNYTVSAGMFWRLLLGTDAMLAFGYAGETGVLEVCPKNRR